MTRLRAGVSSALRRAKIRRYERKQWQQLFADEDARAHLRRIAAGGRDTGPNPSK